jgi:hypothetical protein
MTRARDGALGDQCTPDTWRASPGSDGLGGGPMRGARLVTVTDGKRRPRRSHQGAMAPALPQPPTSGRPVPGPAMAMQFGDPSP